jgi:6-phosphogluconolactonase/glucosamine-6-phosphate isomerase/deaminase
MGLHAVAESSADVHMELWHMFFVDERCVPLTHKDSNYSAVVTQLTAKVSTNTSTAVVFRQVPHYSKGA